jgi:hypothetical protein
VIDNYNMASERDPPPETHGVEDFFADDKPSFEGSGSSTADPAAHETSTAQDPGDVPDEHLEPAVSGPAQTHAQPAQPAPNMLPGRERRRSPVERLFVRIIATGGVIAIGVAIGAIMASSNVQGWIIGLVISGVTVVLSAILWSSRQL